MVTVPAAATQNIIVLGDSLSAAYGIDEQDGWVQLLRNRLDDHNHEARVINASISGETTGGGLSRLPKLMESYQPALLIVELGGNDGLRGYPIGQMKNNLTRIVELGQQHGARVILLGIRIPPNYGKRYSDLFFNTFAAVAEKTQTPLVPFFLDGIGTNRKLMQADGIHPTKEAQSMMLENVWPTISSNLVSQ